MDESGFVNDITPLTRWEHEARTARHENRTYPEPRLVESDTGQSSSTDNSDHTTTTAHTTSPLL